MANPKSRGPSSEFSRVIDHVKPNVTDYPQAETGLERTVSFLNATLASIPDGIVVVNIAGYTVAFNQKFLQMWNLPEKLVEPEKTQERLVFLANQLKDAEGYLKKTAELYAQPEAEAYDVLELKDGRVIERYTQPQRLGDQVIGRVWSFRDITQQQRVGHALRRNEANFAAAQRIAHVGNWETDILTNHLTWSDEIYRIFGLKPQEFDATVDAFFARVHPDDLDYVLKAVDEAVAGRGTYNVDHRIVRSNGEIRFVHQEAEVTFDEAGKPLRMLGIVQDVTDRKHLELKIHQSLEQRGRQVQVSAQVAQDIVSATDLSDLYQRVVTRIQEQFGYYHTQILRYDPANEAMTLAIGYGKIGLQMLAEGYQLPLGSGVIGQAAALGVSVLQPDIAETSISQPHPLLSEAKGEIAVPIKWGQPEARVQANALRGFINSRFDGFIVCIIDTMTILPLAREALSRGVQVVTQSVDLGDSYQTSYVGAEEFETGYMLGIQAGDWAKTHLPANQTLKVGVFNAPQTVQREAGIMAGIKASFGDNFEIVANETAADPVISLPIAERWLRTYPDLHMIVGINDGCALGAYQAVIAAGKNNSERFFIGGVDAIDEALGAIAEGGAFQATVDKSPAEEGTQAVRALVAAIAGQPYAKKNTIQTSPVNQANLAEFLARRKAQKFDEPNPLSGLDLGSIKIGLSVMNLDNPFFIAFTAAAKKEAERLGIELIVNDPRPVLGVLHVQSSQAGILDTEDQLVLEGLCAQIAAAIESTRLRREMEDQLRELNALQRLMSREGWQAFQSTRAQETQAYLFDQTSVQATTIEQLGLSDNWMHSNESDDAVSAANGHIVAKSMAVQGEIIGALGIQNNTDTPLLPEDQAFLDAVAGQVAEALERARLLEQMQKRALEMETVFQVSAAASTILDPNKLLQDVVDLTKERFSLYHAHIYLLNEAGDTLKLAAGAGEIGQQMVAMGWSIPLAREYSLVARATRTRTTVVVGNVHQSLDFMPNPLLPETRSEMAIPLMVGDSVLGVLDVQSDRVNRFSPEDVRVQTTLAAQVAVALRNAGLYQQTQSALVELQQSQELLRTTIDAMPDWIFIKDRSHRYRLVNQGFADSLHLRAEDLIGKNDLEVGFPEEVVKGNPEKGIRGFWADDIEVIDSGQSKFIESESGFIDGRHLFLSTIKVPLRDATGNVWGVLGFVRDITQREQLLSEAENLYKASRRINEAKDLQEIVTALGDAGPVSIINRVLLFTFEHNALDQVEAMTVVAAWHNGQGMPPSPVGRRYERNTSSLVELALSREPLFFNDVQHDERIDALITIIAQQQNIRATVILPLQVGNRELGALILQAEEVHEFTQQEIQFYLSLTPQISVALDNQRLLAETRAALAEVEQTQRRYTVQAWEVYRDRGKVLSYEQVREGMPPLGDNLLPEIAQTIAQSQQSKPDNRELVVNNLQNESGPNLIVPLTVRGETIGVLGLQEIDPHRKWSPEEIALIETITEQIAQAAENIRLIDETQQRAAREKRVNEIGEKIQAAQSLEEALKIAVKEVGLSLQMPQTMVQLEVK